jgi:hypothetical protein
MNTAVAAAVAHDPEAPIKMILKIVPYAGLPLLQKMAADENTHVIVRRRIKEFLDNRPRGGEN